MSILETLDVIIAFSTLMLIFSLIVTSCVQYTQYFLRLRGRVLRSNIEALCQIRGADKKSSQDIAEHMLQPVILQKIRNRPLSRAILGTRTSVIELGDFERGFGAISSLGDADLEGAEQQLAGAAADDIKDSFEKVSNSSQMEFGYYVKIISFIWAFLVAFGFQVSTPDLINRLSIDPALRAQIIEAAPIILSETEEFREALIVSDQTAFRAMTSLMEKYPQHAAQFEEISGRGARRDLLLREVELVIEDLPQSSVIYRDYETFLRKAGQERLNLLTSQIDDQAERLSRFKIDFWDRGWSYYTHFASWVGVLITSLLLTLGAPFWYDLIKHLSGLRDALQRRANPKTTPTDKSNLNAAPLTTPPNNAPVTGS